MIRTLRVSDLLRLPAGLPGGEDMARDVLGAPGPRLSVPRIVRWVSAPRASTEPVTATTHGRLDALAVLRVRSGPSAWTLAHLYSTPRGHAQVTMLLAGCIARASAHRAERLFLRIPEWGPLREQAVAAGFLPCGQERMLAIGRPLASSGHGGLGLRPVVPADAHGLFRLYNGVVPAQARAVTGLMLDQWADAQERPSPGARSFVWERAGTVYGWVRLGHRSDRLVVEAMAHPEEGPEAIGALVDDVAHLARGHRGAVWVVPDHQRALSAVLARRGWAEEARCTLLGGTTGITVPVPGAIPAQA